MPFVGYAGHQLNTMLEDAGIKRNECYVTNVFCFRPTNNDISGLCGGRSEGITGYPPLLRSKFVLAKYIPELNRLAQEIADVEPNVIVCLGNTASWALYGRTTISKYRGTTAITTHTAIGYKGIATYHPQAVNYMASLRPVAVIDLMKAKRESEYPEIRRPKREVWIEPGLEDLNDFDKRYLRTAETISIDIETAGKHITCIGFGTSTHALVVPFFDSRKAGGSYWPDAEYEREAWSFVRDILCRGTPKVFQNGLYDISFLWRAYGLSVKNAAHDTMLLHHALQPESLKSLGFLGSIYTDESAWKQMRTTTTIKRDE